MRGGDYRVSSGQSAIEKAEATEGNPSEKFSYKKLFGSGLLTKNTYSNVLDGLDFFFALYKRLFVVVRSENGDLL